MPRAVKDAKTKKPTKAASTSAKASAPKKAGPVKKASATQKPKVQKTTVKKTTAQKTTIQKTSKAPKVSTTKKDTKTTKAAKPNSVAKPAAAKPAAAAAKAAPATPKKAGVDFNNFEPYKPKRGEKYMNDQQQTHFREILLNWKSELMQEVDRTVTHMKDEAANFPDPADRATQEEEFSLELRTRDRERKLIKKIDATMELIDQNDYGYCEACGVEIGIQRLEARPTATQCIDCKTLAEIKEKQEMG
jgi:DnaK suppressor protein